MAQAVEEWYKQMPIITRSYLTAAVVTSVGCSLEIISPYNLYLNPIFADNFSRLVPIISPYNLYLNSIFADNFSRLVPIISPYNLYLNPKLVLERYQVWRLVTNFLYFRKIDLDFLFHMFFLARYCKLLEENSFRGRTADFLYMLLFGAGVLTLTVILGGMIPYFSSSFASVLFLSNSLTFMMVYVWSKQNPLTPMSFLGLFNFTAAYLPWVLLTFSVLVGANPSVDLLGMFAGHAYYYLDDVYPMITGRHPLRTPSFIRSLFADDPIVITQPENIPFAAPLDNPHED